MQDIVKEYAVPFVFEDVNLKVGKRWYFKNMKIEPGDVKPRYDLAHQANTDVISHIINDELGFDYNEEYAMIATHCGYCDGELLNMSTFSVIRGRELEALCSPEVKKWVKDHNIELVNFDEYIKDRR